MTDRLPRQLARFLIVGCVGFAVDAGLLYALIRGGGDPYAMRLVSFGAAVTVTWLCNRHWTFRDRPRRGTRQEYLCYLGVQTAGAAANYVVYAICLTAIGVSPVNSVLALACGSLAGLAINFVGARRIVFPASAS